MKIQTLDSGEKYVLVPAIPKKGGDTYNEIISRFGKDILILTPHALMRRKLRKQQRELLKLKNSKKTA